jgi:molecular chaperone GrpE
MEKVIHAVEKFFHAVEVPDFRRRAPGGPRIDFHSMMRGFDALAPVPSMPWIDGLPHPEYLPRLDMTKKHAHSESESAAPADDVCAPGAEPAAGTDANAVAPESPPEAAEPLQHQLLRLQADFDNYRKRMAREKKDWIAFASEKLVLELLPVLDHFELGLADSAKNGAPAAFVEGFQLVYNQLRAAIEKAGVEAVEAEGQPFDPNLHEAITHMPSADVPEEHVVAQTRRGYKIGDKLVRAAQVVVSSGPPADP